MNGTSPLEGRGDTFERRLLKELTEIDARRPIATSPRARPRRGGQRRPGMLVVAVVAALVVAGGATAAASIVLRPDRPDKVLPLGTATILRPGERTGIKGMGCQPGSVVRIRLGDRTLGTTRAETGHVGPRRGRLVRGPGDHPGGHGARQAHARRDLPPAAGPGQLPGAVPHDRHRGEVVA
jgi:hypothetical protein